MTSCHPLAILRNCLQSVGENEAQENEGTCLRRHTYSVSGILYIKYSGSKDICELHGATLPSNLNFIVQSAGSFALRALHVFIQTLRQSSHQSGFSASAHRSMLAAFGPEP